MILLSAMPGRSSATNMGDDNAFGSKEMDVQKPHFSRQISASPTRNISKVDQTYKTLPEHTTTKPRFSIIKATFTNEKREKSPIVREDSPGKLLAMERTKGSTKSRFSICKSPIVADETTGAIIEFSTGIDIAPPDDTSYSNKDSPSIPFKGGVSYRSRFSPLRSSHLGQGDWNSDIIKPLQSERSIERRLRRVTETEEDLPSPTKATTTQQSTMELVEEEVDKPTANKSRFSIMKTSLQPDIESRNNAKLNLPKAVIPPDPSNSITSGERFKVSKPKATSPSIKSKEMPLAPRKSLLKHSNSVDAPGGGSSGSSSCSSVASGKSFNTTKLSLLKASNTLEHEESKSTSKPEKSMKTTNVSFGKEVIYLDGEPIGTPPPSRERSRSDASATLSKLRNITMRKKDPNSGSKMAWLREKQTALKQAKEVETKSNIPSEVKPTHKRTQSCDVSKSTDVNNEQKGIDVSLDKLPDKPRPRTRSEKLQRGAKSKVVLEEVSTKTSFDWPLGRLGKLRQKYTNKNKKQGTKTSGRRKSKGEGDSTENENKLSKKSKSVEAISKAHHPVAVSNKKPHEGKEEADDLVYELPTHYQTVLPVIKSRVIRPVMGLFRQNSSKGKLKKNKRDRQRHSTDSEAGSICSKHCFP